MEERRGAHPSWDTFPSKVFQESQTHFFWGPWKLWETRLVWECAEWKSPPECVQVRVIMNKAAVCFHRVVSLSKADLSPRSNLGYLACNQLRPLTTLTAAAGWALCLGLVLSSPPFFHSPVEASLKKGSSLYCPNKEAMAEHQEVCSPEGTPAADTYPKKILEYMEGFLISKVIIHSRLQGTHKETHL